LAEENLYNTDQDIKKDREQIDDLDEKILKLLSDRARLSIDIAQIKLKKKLPVFVPERENELLDKIIEQNTGPFDADAIRNIFNAIMNESKQLQHSIVLEESDNDKFENE